MLNEAHTRQRRGSLPLRVLIARMRHEGCGGSCCGAEGYPTATVSQVALLSCGDYMAVEAG
jgi:hypothetical protein